MKYTEEGRREAEKGDGYEAVVDIAIDGYSEDCDKAAMRAALDAVGHRELLEFAEASGPHHQK